MVHLKLIHTKANSNNLRYISFWKDIHLVYKESIDAELKLEEIDYEFIIQCQVRMMYCIQRILIASRKLIQ